MSVDSHSGRVAGVKDAIEKRYVNAIPVAKKWRRTLLPDWHLESTELNAYFGPTGFSPKLRRDIESTPADWIKHLEDQIAKRGRYRDVTRQANRDWDRLLTYNEDDCRDSSMSTKQPSANWRSGRRIGRRRSAWTLSMRSTSASVGSAASSTSY
jgi:hypothetical protein